MYIMLLTIIFLTKVLLCVSFDMPNDYFAVVAHRIPIRTFADVCHTNKDVVSHLEPAISYPLGVYDYKEDLITYYPKQKFDTFGYKYDKECSFVVSDSNNNNCFKYFDKFSGADCTFVHEFNIGDIFDTLADRHNKFCWGVFKNHSTETFSFTGSMHVLKYKSYGCHYHLWSDPIYRFIVEYKVAGINYLKLLFAPAVKYREFNRTAVLDNVSIVYKFKGNKVAVLNTSPWYMPQIMRLPHYIQNTSVWSFKLDDGIIPLSMFKRNSRSMAYEYSKFNCTRIYTDKYKYCLELFLEETVDHRHYPDDFIIDDEPHDLFEINYVDKEMFSIITKPTEDLFNKVGNDIKEEITKAFGGINIFGAIGEKFNSIFDWFGDKIKAIENWFVDIFESIEKFFGTIFKFLQTGLIALIKKGLEYTMDSLAKDFVWYDGNHILIELLIFNIVLFYIFRSYILIIILTMLLICVIGTVRTYSNVSPLEVVIIIINYIFEQNYLMDCSSGTCIPLYEIYRNVTKSEL